MAKATHEASDPIDQVSARPDFQALIYSGPLGVRDQKITKEMNLPPTFIAVGDTDKFAPILTSHYLALREAGVSAELHIYAKTGHGFGFRDTNIGKPSNGFLQQFFDFLGARDAEKSVRAICLFQCRRRRQRHGGASGRLQIAKRFEQAERLLKFGYGPPTSGISGRSATVLNRSTAAEIDCGRWPTIAGEHFLRQRQVALPRGLDNRRQFSRCGGELTTDGLQSAPVGLPAGAGTTSGVDWMGAAGFAVAGPATTPGATATAGPVTPSDFEYAAIVSSNWAADGGNIGG